MLYKKIFTKLSNSLLSNSFVKGFTGYTPKSHISKNNSSLHTAPSFTTAFIYQQEKDPITNKGFSYAKNNSVAQPLNLTFNKTENKQHIDLNKPIENNNYSDYDDGIKDEQCNLQAEKFVGKTLLEREQQKLATQLGVQLVDFLQFSRVIEEMHQTTFFKNYDDNYNSHTIQKMGEYSAEHPETLVTH